MPTSDPQRRDGWRVRTGGDTEKGFWCQLRKAGRVLHADGNSLNEAVAEAIARIPMPDEPQPDHHSIGVELMIQKLAAIGDAANDMRCNHPPDDGSDDPCSGDDCIKCYLISLTEQP